MVRVFLPGEDISDEIAIDANGGKPISLGPGLSHKPPKTVSTSMAGTLASTTRRKAAWLETNGRGRYSPTVGDLVIAKVHHSGMEVYHCALAPHSALATLGQLAFESVSKKTRPQLHSGSLVYARVATVHRDLDTEIECVHPTTGKAEGMGELKDGMLFDISLGMARRLLMPQPREQGQIVILEELGDKGISFEVAVGRNGLLWVNSHSKAATIAIGRIVQKADRDALRPEDQIPLLKQVLRKLDQT